jgi:hypothetical protein
MSMWRRIKCIFRPVLTKEEALEAVLSSPEGKKISAKMRVKDGLLSYRVSTFQFIPGIIFEVSKYDGSVKLVFPRKSGAR